MPTRAKAQALGESKSVKAGNAFSIPLGRRADILRFGKATAWPRPHTARPWLSSEPTSSTTGGHTHEIAKTAVFLVERVVQKTDIGAGQVGDGFAVGHISRASSTAMSARALSSMQ